MTGKDVPDETARMESYRYISPTRTLWPTADFIIGNPPFIGNKRMRDRLGDGYLNALGKSYPGVPKSVDFVMYWWFRAAHQEAKWAVSLSGGREKFSFPGF